MGCSESKVQEHIDEHGSARCIFTLVKPREPVPEPEVEDGGRTADEFDHYLVPHPETKRNHGAESGDDEEVEEEFPFITENSAPALVNKVINEFVPVVDVRELVVIGTECPRLLTGVQKSRAEEDRIIEALRREGLISKPLSRTGRGVSFEILGDKSVPDLEERASSSIAILEKSRERFQKDLTSDSIHEKLQRAQERRIKQLDEEKDKRLKSGTARHRKSLEERFQESEKSKLLQQEKWEQGLKKREEHLTELRDKLKEKHERIKTQALQSGFFD